MDINRALKMAVNTGKVLFGAKLAVKAAKSNDVKLYIRASNFPEEEIGTFEEFDIPTYHYTGNNYELGAVCGKPFSISILSVIEPGESDIMDLVKDQE
jgi:large subunit ribosomal protein L30e